MPTMLIAGAVALLLAHTPDPRAHAVLDTALARMGGRSALASVERIRLEVMTEWQRIDFDARRQPMILSYELATELRDYTIPAWRYSRRFFSTGGTSEVVDVVTDSVAAMGSDGRWSPQNVAYLEEREEVFTFTPERIVRLAREASDARALPDTVVAGERHARIVATIGRFHPTLHFRRSDGLLALARFRAAQPNDFGLAPWGTMDVEIAYSRWQKVAGTALFLPMQIDVRRVGRPYKRMTTISTRVNPAIPADSFVVSDSLRAAFLATARRPMFDLPMDSARIIDGSFATFGAPGTPTGAVKVGGRWVLLEAGTAPLTIERSVAFLRRSDPAGPIAGAVLTSPYYVGGTAWLTRQPSMSIWLTDGARAFVEAALRGWPTGDTPLRHVSANRWIRVGTDSIRVELVDLPDYPGTPVVYVPALRWAYAAPPTQSQLAVVAAHARRRGWRIDRVGSARDFVGVPLPPVSP